MPAIQVARTDTFEQQRQKINQIGSSLFNITAGGSDLSTGNLKLGDGTRIIPSLAFVSDSELGLYKSGLNTIGFVSKQKNIVDFSNTNITSYVSQTYLKKSIASGGLTITNAGSGYDAGTYTDITLLGGSGSDALATIVVDTFSGTATNGTGYRGGTFTNVGLVGGSGSGASISFTINGIVGTLTSGGTGYTAGSYLSASLTGGSGTGAKADITVSSLAVSTTTAGSGYPNGIYLDVPFTNGSGTNARANVTIVSGGLASTTITNSGTGYTTSDTLGISLSQSGTQTIAVSVNTEIFNLNGINVASLNLVAGKTYEFDQLGTSNNSYPLCIGTTAGSTASALGSTSGVTYIINGTTYNDFTSYSTNFASGTSTRKVRFVVPASPAASNLFFFSTGITSKSLTLVTAAGSGAALSVTTAPGIVTSVVITDSGSGYQQNNILSASSIGSGTGFQYTVTNTPGNLTTFDWVTKGVNYTSGNVLTLPPVKTGVTTTLQGTISNVSTTLTSGSRVITVSSTTGISAGYLVSKVSGTGTPFSGSTVTSVDSSTQITLSANPDVAGSVVLNFTPPNPTQLTVSSATNIVSGSTVSVTAGTGTLASGTTVVSASGTTVILSQAPTSYGPATLTFTPPYGTGSGWSYTINSLGSIGSVTINSTSPGIGYNLGNTLSVNPSDLSSPITYTVTSKSVQRLTLTGTVNYASSGLVAGNKIEVQGSGGSGSIIWSIITSGGNIQEIVVESANFQAGQVITEVVTGSGPTFTIATSTSENRFFINTGSGETYAPNLTLYVGNTYIFDLSDSSVSGHPLLFSEYKDGIWSPSLVQNLSTTLSLTSKQITVTSTTGILPGMAVTKISGNGVISTSCRVTTVDSSTTLTLSEFPSSAGPVVLDFSGFEYTSGVTKAATSTTLKITASTPSPLYYYCGNHPNMSGSDNNEAVITISSNNPKPLGSGLILTVSNIQNESTIINDIVQGKVTANEVQSVDLTSDTGTITTFTSTTSTIDYITTDSISSPALAISSTDTLTLSSVGNTTINGNIVIAANGNLTSSGFLKTTNSVNVNDVLSITNNTISTSGTNNLILSPASTRTAKINASTALIIPVGSTSGRPTGLLAESGAIRFNTDTNQYEGYSGTTSSWSSLGGVRDLDGNTYITAELTVGSNDNTLWFYNDNNNTVKFTTEYQEFVNVKKIRSVNTAAPSYVNWQANTPVSTGQYLKYRNNIFLVVTGGTTGTSGSEPTNITGSNFSNGTATLKFHITAVAPLTFDEISELRIDPLGFTPLSINGDLRLANNTISSDVNDIIILPNTGKKLTINAKTSLVLPVGTTNERGNPTQGSVRFNTTISQYEGYDGTNWSSLGGVRDVDGNTYIIPELTAGGNQNILYFYNNGSNTLQVTENDIQLKSIDTITSSVSNALHLEAQSVTFNSSAVTLDTSSSTRAFLSTTKSNFDLGLSSGLNNDTLLRLSGTGDIYFNLGFGTGFYNGNKLLNSTLKEFELTDYKLSTTRVTLTKNTVNSGSAILYDPSLHKSARVQVCAHNETSGDKEFIEYSVIDKGTDIFFTDFGNVKTGSDLISCVFDFNANGNVRVTFTLNNALTSGHVVKVTVISNIIKR